MADPQAAVVLQGKNQAGQAFDEAKAQIRSWSQSLKGDIKDAQGYVEGFKGSIEFAKQALTGFGAIALGTMMVRGLYDIAAGAVETAAGLGEFVTKADEAGAKIRGETFRDAEALTGAFKELKQEVLLAGAELVGPWLGDMKTAVNEVTGFLQRNLQELKDWAEGAKREIEAAREFARNGIAAGAGALAGDAPVRAGGVTQAERRKRQAASRDFSEDDFGPDFEDPLAKDIEKAQEAARKLKAINDKKLEDARLAREKEDLQWMEAQAIRLAKEDADIAAEDERRRIRAEAIAVEFAATQEQKLQAVDFWAQQQLALVDGHEAAETRIRQEWQRRRDAISQESMKQESKTKDAEEKKDAARDKRILSSTLQHLTGAFGQSKGFRKAMALINTYTGVTAALAEGPAGLPLAAAITIQGLKQVRSIESTQPGSGGGGLGGFGGGGLGGFGGGLGLGQPPPPAAPAAPVNQINLDLRVMGSLLTQEDITRATTEAIEVAGANGQTTIVTKRVS